MLLNSIWHMLKESITELCWVWNFLKELVHKYNRRVTQSRNLRDRKHPNLQLVQAFVFMCSLGMKLSDISFPFVRSRVILYFCFAWYFLWLGFSWAEVDSLSFPYLHSGVHGIWVAKMLETPCSQAIENTRIHLEHLQCILEDKETRGDP